MHVRKAVFVIRRLLVSEEKFVWFSEEKGVTYVRLRCVVSSPSVVRPSLMLVGNNKVVEDEVRWRRSKGVVMNSFYLFRNSKSAIWDHQFIAVIEELHYCFWAHKWIAKLCFNNTHNEGSLFAALNIWFVLGAARLVVVRLVGCLRRNGLAGCWDGSVLLDVWGKYSRSPCSFVCRERSGARIDIVNFCGDNKWCLWKACWMFLIHIQLGFLGLKYIRRKESIN